MAEKASAGRPGGGASPAHWLIAISLAVIAASLLIEVSASTIRADDDVGSAQAASVFAVAGKVTKDTYGLYLVDWKNGTVCMYQWLPGSRKLRLMAARNVTFDRQLDDYNTEPSPRVIKKEVERSRRLHAAPTGP